MAILKKGNKQNFTVVDNNIFKNKNLSLKDIGLLCFLLSLPENWEFSENGLLKILEKDGQTAIRTALKNLEREKYLTRKQERNGKGHIIGVEWIAFDSPYLENHNLDNASLENMPQVSTKEVNTKKENKHSSGEQKNEHISIG